VTVLVLFLPLRIFVPLDGEYVFMALDVDVFFPGAGQLGADRMPALTLGDVRGRSPPLQAGSLVDRVVEEPRQLQRRTEPTCQGILVRDLTRAAVR
jgi:hypothetical protein